VTTAVIAEVATAAAITPAATKVPRVFRNFWPEAALFLSIVQIKFQLTYTAGVFTGGRRHGFQAH